MSQPFWRRKSLHEMNTQEWESLCDGCARCCMHKLEDEDTGHYTAVVCHLLDGETCHCTRYAQRHQLVPDCVVLDATRAEDFHWLPVTCAYRTLAEQRELAWWHPLVSGDPQTVVQAGISVHNRVVSSEAVHVDDMQDMIVTWVEQ